MADAVKLAVLIDADNAKSENVEPLMAEIAKYGVASVKRAYGNWTTPNLGGWKQVLVEQSIQPMQQFSYTVGKNSTDSALIIDAMDLLYTGRFGGFCLISSDSDFTRLAQRIREAGLLVYGFGERKTPTSLVSACDKFVYMDVLREPAPAGPASNNEPRPKRGEQRPDGKLLQIFKAAVDAASDDEGWANLGAIGNHVSKRAPDFDPRNYGFKKLSELLRSLSIFEWEERKGADGKGRAMLLRHRGGSAPAQGANSQPAAPAVQTATPPAPASAAVPAPARANPPPAPPAPPRRHEPRQADRPFMPGLLNTAAVAEAAASVPSAPSAIAAPTIVPVPVPVPAPVADQPAAQPQPWKLPPMPSRQLPKQAPPVAAPAPAPVTEPVSPPAIAAKPEAQATPPSPPAAKPARTPRKPKADADPTAAPAKPAAKRAKPKA